MVDKISTCRRIPEYKHKDVQDNFTFEQHWRQRSICIALCQLRSE